MAGSQVAVSSVNGKTWKLECARSRIVGSTAKRTPPCTTPQRLPAPPTTVIKRNVIDRERPKSSFDTICSMEANSAPPMPAMAPEITNAISL